VREFTEVQVRVVEVVVVEQPEVVVVMMVVFGLAVGISWSTFHQEKLQQVRNNN
jgi:hypothetical protein